MHVQKPVRISIDKNVWKEVQPNGDEKWFAIEPVTGKEIQIDPEDAGFYTEAWQSGEREVDAHIAAGNVKTFDTMDEFLADLDADDE